VASKAYLVVAGANVSLDLPPGKSEYIIGRADEISGVFPEINLEPFGGQDAGVSRRHLKLWNVYGTWMVEDLNTVNGTFLNRQRLAPNKPAPLNPGDELRLGRLALIFKLD
jgi:pSer/pThr/pTyr-binding forkhead associated (FHA) protein